MKGKLKTIQKILEENPKAYFTESGGLDCHNWALVLSNQDLFNLGHTKELKNGLSTWFETIEPETREETFYLWYDRNDVNSTRTRVCSEQGKELKGSLVDFWDDPDFNWQKIDGSKFTKEVEW